MATFQRVIITRGVAVVVALGVATAAPAAAAPTDSTNPGSGNGNPGSSSGHHFPRPGSFTNPGSFTDPGGGNGNPGSGKGGVGSEFLVFKIVNTFIKSIDLGATPPVKLNPLPPWLTLGPVLVPGGPGDTGNGGNPSGPGGGGCIFVSAC